jgi:hypothetical protein
MCAILFPVGWLNDLGTKETGGAGKSYFQLESSKDEVETVIGRSTHHSDWAFPVPCSSTFLAWGRILDFLREWHRHPRALRSPNLGPLNTHFLK